jgi:integrase
MKVKFYLSRPTAKTESSIIISVAYNNEWFRIPAGESINPKYWNAKKHEARQTPSFPESPEFNTRLRWIASQVNKCYLQYRNENEGAEPAPDLLKKLIDNALGRNQVKRMGFFAYFEDFVNRQKDGLRINAKKGTIINPDDAKHYQHTLNTMQEFNPKLDFKDIGLAFYNDFIKFLNKKAISLNTTGAHIKRLKVVLNEAKANGYPVNPDFESKYFAKMAEEADNIALTLGEVEALQALDFTGNKRLEAVRDLFIIGCHTGLRYSDFSTLAPADIANGFIKVTQQKTGGKITIPVHDVVANIIKKYGGELPASISNQKTNSYLKEICQLVKPLQAKESKTTTKGGKKVTVIQHRWELVSTHTARRTFATMQYNNGVPSITIMAITGHKTEKDFLKYIKVTPDEHAIKMREHWADGKRAVMKAV